MATGAAEVATCPARPSASLLAARVPSAETLRRRRGRGGAHGTAPARPGAVRGRAGQGVLCADGGAVCGRVQFRRDGSEMDGRRDEKKKRKEEREGSF